MLPLLQLRGQPVQRSAALAGPPMRDAVHRLLSHVLRVLRQPCCASVRSQCGRQGRGSAGARPYVAPVACCISLTEPAYPPSVACRPPVLLASERRCPRLPQCRRLQATCAGPSTELLSRCAPCAAMPLGCKHSLPVRPSAPSRHQRLPLSKSFLGTRAAHRC